MEGRAVVGAEKKNIIEFPRESREDVARDNLADVSTTLSREQQLAVDAVTQWHIRALGCRTFRDERDQVFRLFGFAGTGKALVFDALVQTPIGPRRIIDLKTGDAVFRRDGKVGRVTGVFPQGVRQAYRVVFRCGATVECDESHLWDVRTAKEKRFDKPYRTRTLREIIDLGVIRPSGDARFSVPLCDPVQYEQREYLLHPYVIGALIGDGTHMHKTPTLCVPDFDEWIVDRVKALLPDWVKVTCSRHEHCSYHRLTDPRKHNKNAVQAELVRLGLGVKSPERRIPAEYLRGSVDQRWDLLRGLMDTDGSCVKNRTSFSTKSAGLAIDIRDLVQSLGGTAIVNAPYREGEIHVNVKTFLCPFALPRKASRWSFSKKNPPSRYIVGVEPSRMCDHVCISVDADDGLFLTNGFVVTHNTTIAIEIARAVGGPNTLFAAYTGKAAHVMHRKGCLGARTIHSLIYNPAGKSEKRLDEIRTELAAAMAESGGRATPKTERLVEALGIEEANVGRPSFKLNSESALCDAPLLIVDECSMVGAQVARDLLSFRRPILVLGDPAQLPPVRDEGYFTGAGPDVMLTEVHRHALDSPVYRMATAVRQGRPLHFWRDGDSGVIDKRELDIDTALGADQVLCGKNDTRRNLNHWMRRRLGRGSVWPVEGDKLVCLRNDRQTGLLNGSMWEAAADASEHVHDPEAGPFPKKPVAPQVDLAVWPHGGERDVDPLAVVAWAQIFGGKDAPVGRARFNAQEFDYGYALTVHKAQGSQWPRVILCDESGVFSRGGASAVQQWLYTGITRAAESVRVYREGGN